MVSVGSCAATVLVIVVDSLLYLDDPEYTAVMFTSFPDRLSGTVYWAVAVPFTTFAYITLPFVSFTVFPFTLNITFPPVIVFPA